MKNIALQGLVGRHAGWLLAAAILLATGMLAHAVPERLPPVTLAASHEAVAFELWLALESDDGEF